MNFTVFSHILSTVKSIIVVVLTHFHRFQDGFLDPCQERGCYYIVACNDNLDKERKKMLQEGDKTILTNVAKVIAVLIVVAVVLMFVASYVGSGL